MTDIQSFTADYARVLHIKDSLAMDGATVVVYNLAKEFDKEINIDWLLFNGQDDNPWYERFEKLGGKIYKFRTNQSRNRIIRYFINYIRLLQFFRTHPYRTIHINTDGFGRIIVLVAAKRERIKQRIVHSHNSNSESEGLSKIPVELNRLRR